MERLFFSRQLFFKIISCLFANRCSTNTALFFLHITNKKFRLNRTPERNTGDSFQNCSLTTPDKIPIYVRITHHDMIFMEAQLSRRTPSSTPRDQCPGRKITWRRICQANPQVHGVRQHVSFARQFSNAVARDSLPTFCNIKVVIQMKKVIWARIKSIKREFICRAA